MQWSTAGTQFMASLFTFLISSTGCKMHITLMSDLILFCDSLQKKLWTKQTLMPYFCPIFVSFFVPAKRHTEQPRPLETNDTFRSKMVKHFAGIHIKQQGNREFKQQAEQMGEKWLGLQQHTCLYLNQEVNTHALEHIMLWMVFEELAYLEMIMCPCLFVAETVWSEWSFFLLFF